jgi:hypothetical protein
VTLLEKAKAHVRPRRRSGGAPSEDRDELMVALLSGEIGVSAAMAALGHASTGNTYSLAATTLIRLIRDGEYELRRASRSAEAK